VTEYGVADLRGQSDADVIAAMLNVTDTRFQGELMRQANFFFKQKTAYEIPAVHRENFPDRVAAALKPSLDAGLLPAFPFGSDFTDVEQRLIPALQILKEATASPLALLGLAWEGRRANHSAELAACLARMQLERPASFADRFYRALLIAALARSSQT
ncbi:acetyl-CoA hydrolase/transferase C-terminal domain-containing protein, partial [Afipia sp. NBIMC_P1-C3]|uniref:acetyl-CoA hydrolase/transferase C-terminal domain-containing protein n=1 Tax=Afipia sp. NBIMC_P1-C3 TaxID=1320554 RepID=UPI00054FE11C